MGWWPSIFGGGDSQTADPLKHLDPKLREFLEKESPVKYKNSKDANQSAPTTSSEQNGPLAAIEASRAEGNAVPSQSLYQDGRYAHLWKNYRPQAEVEAENMTDHDKLMAVLDGYNERKANIARVAMENCAEAQEEWVNCMKHGEWKDQLQMCRHQVRNFEKCYTMQSRFLRALGHGSVIGRSPEIDDDIQMHADALYQRVLRHEDAVKKAKEEGTQIPIFDPTVPVSQRSPAATTVEPSEELRQQWKEKLDQLPEEERPVEEAALRADLQAKSDVAKTMKEFYESKRKKTGDEPKLGEQPKSIGDSLLSLFTGR